MNRGNTGLRFSVVLAMAAIMAVTVPLAKADAVTAWNRTAGDIIVDSGMGPLPADRALAILHGAIYEAVNAITRRYPASGSGLKASPDASIDAAVAAASRTALAQLVPIRKEAIDTAYQSALAALEESPAKSRGVAVGNDAAAIVLAMRAEDGATAEEEYRPHTSAGKYVPTVIPEAPHWLRIKPWLMDDPSRFRPGPPPELTSERWARDYNEVRMLGAKHSKHRSATQTEIARFWEEVMPPIYHELVRSVAEAPRRDVTRNARLFAAVTQATNDALIAVFDAKYHYGFWRPVTAIRNGDIDGNEATERDPSWMPFVETPMHPEYPCAHCIVSGAVGAVLKAEVGPDPLPTLTTTSKAAGGVTRSWTTIDDFVREVANARIYDGVHYRNSGEVGTAMGKKIGDLAVRKYLQSR